MRLFGPSHSPSTCATSAGRYIGEVMMFNLCGGEKPRVYSCDCPCRSCVRGECSTLDPKTRAELAAAVHGETK